MNSLDKQSLCAAIQATLKLKSVATDKQLWTKIKWHGLEPGSTQLPYPDYPEEINKFFATFMNQFWVDTDYANKPVQKWIMDDEFITQASIEQLKSILTGVVRGERFNDGWWQSLLEKGRMEKIVERLEEINKQFCIN